MTVPAAGFAQTPSVPLVLEPKLALGAGGGRIDDRAVDLQRQQLFVAELGNDSTGVVDLTGGWEVVGAVDPEYHSCGVEAGTPSDGPSKLCASRHARSAA